MKSQGYDVEAYKERKKQEIKAISERLEAGVRELMTSERYTTFLDAMSKFHNYSVNNSLLIAMQKPDATHVASYRTWQKLGRHVNKGERGIQVLVPTPVKIKKEYGDEPVRAEDEPEEVQQVMRFKVGYVFDLAQTPGEPFPSLSVEELVGSVEGYGAFMDAVKEVSPVPVRFAEIQRGAKGYYDRAAEEIVIQSEMSEAQTMKTAVHEVTHATLHNREAVKERSEPVDRRTMEVEAESTAYIVSNYFGLDTSEYSFGYISAWSSGRDTKELKSSMEIIRTTAGELIDGIWDRTWERLQDMNLTAEKTQEKYSAVYQAEGCPAEWLFRGLSELQDGLGMRLEQLPYRCVYDGTVSAESTLDDIYTDFNLDKPAGYEGRSVSVGDVIVVKAEGQAYDRGYYVDSFGFAELMPEQTKEIVQAAEVNQVHRERQQKERSRAR